MDGIINAESREAEQWNTNSILPCISLVQAKLADGIKIRY